MLNPKNKEHYLELVIAKFNDGVINVTQENGDADLLIKNRIISKLFQPLFQKTLIIGDNKISFTSEPKANSKERARIFVIQHTEFSLSIAQQYVLFHIPSPWY